MSGKLTDLDCRKRGAQVAAGLPNNLHDSLRILQYATDIMRFCAGQTASIEDNTQIPIPLTQARRQGHQ